MITEPERHHRSVSSTSGGRRERLPHALINDVPFHFLTELRGTTRRPELFTARYWYLLDVEFCANLAQSAHSSGAKPTRLPLSRSPSVTESRGVTSPTMPQQPRKLRRQRLPQRLSSSESVRNRIRVPPTSQTV